MNAVTVVAQKLWFGDGLRVVRSAEGEVVCQVCGTNDSIREIEENNSDGRYNGRIDGIYRQLRK